jgi:hypothetical protein
LDIHFLKGVKGFSPPCVPRNRWKQILVGFEYPPSPFGDLSFLCHRLTPSS